MSRDEINRLLAEKVMGWRWVAMPDLGNTWRHYENELGEPALIGKAWNPHDDIAQAMMVVDKLAVPMAMYRENTGNGWYWVVRMNKGVEFFDDFLSCAICEAAMKVVEND